MLYLEDKHLTKESPMTIATLRKIGGSTCITIPRVFLDRLELGAGTIVDISLDGSGLRIQPQKPVYNLDDLLAATPSSRDLTEEDRDWLDAEPEGKEIW
jgi:antitoxin component of MazEF toxin-antitoxin module